MFKPVSEEKMEGNQENRSSSLVAVLFTFGLIFLPGTALALVYYFVLLKKIKLGFKTILLITLGLLGVIAIAFMQLNPVDIFSNIFADFGSIGDFIPMLIKTYLLLSLTFGVIAGQSYLGLLRWEIKAQPQRWHDPAYWYYKFEFRRSLLGLVRLNHKNKQLQAGKLSNKQRIAIGIDEEYCTKKLAPKDHISYLYLSDLNRHGLITGPTGSGKTVSLKNLVISDIDAGRPTCFVDFKGDGELATDIAQICKNAGVEFVHFMPVDEDEYNIDYSAGQWYYDPFKDLDNDSIVSMILNMRAWDTASDVYKGKLKALLIVLLNCLDLISKNSKLRRKCPDIIWNKGKLAMIGSAVGVVSGGGSGEWRIGQIALACENTPLEGEAARMDAKIISKDGFKGAADELTNMMSAILNSGYGKWMNVSQGKNKSKNSRMIDFQEMLNNPGYCILFSIDSNTAKDIQQAVGSLIMSNLTQQQSYRMKNPDAKKVRMCIYVDEFSAIPPDTVIDLQTKARGVNISVFIAQQSVEQIVNMASITGGNGEAFLNAMLDNLNIILSHGRITEPSAEKFSEWAGKTPKSIYSFTRKQLNPLASLVAQIKKTNLPTWQTKEENDWIYPPEFFQKNETASSANKGRTTASYLIKSNSDPRFKSHTGVLARRVLLIPDKRALGNFEDAQAVKFNKKNAYHESKDYFDSNDDDFNVSFDEFEEEIEVKTPKKKKQEEIDNYKDGGFFYEDLEEDFDEEIEEEEEVKPLPKTKPLSKSQASRKLAQEFKPKTLKQSTPKPKPLPKKTSLVKPIIEDDEEFDLTGIFDDEDFHDGVGQLPPIDF